MKLIPESKIDEIIEEKFPVLNKGISEMTDLEFRNNEIKKTKQRYFKRGVEFAENELQNLAIEFAECCGTFYSFESIYKIWDNSRKEYTTQQLFEKFKEERKI